MEVAYVQTYGEQPAGRVNSHLASNLAKNSQGDRSWHRLHAARSPQLFRRQQTSILSRR